jgi:translocator assembly and maintenance protein 41
VAKDIDTLKHEVGAVIRETVKWSSIAQSLKGILTAGPVRSARYLASKTGKWWAATRNSG